MNKKILFAEDSSVIQNLTTKVLSQLKYNVLSAKNGMQVLDLIEEHDFDLILLDIYMPVMNGMDCAQQIRKTSGNNQKTPIIAITGNANNYTMKDFQKVGINECIHKPINYDSLAETVKKYMDDN